MQYPYYYKLEVILEKARSKKRYFITDNIIGDLTIKRGINESATLELSMRRHNVVNTRAERTNTALSPEAGDGISVIVDGYRMFYGWVTEPNYSGDIASLTANDQLFYLSNYSDVANFGDVTLRDLVVRILNDYRNVGKGLSWGRDFDVSPYTIPQVIMDGDSLLGVIRDGIDSTFQNTGRRYYLLDEYKNIKLLSEASLTLSQRHKCIIIPDTIMGDYKIAIPIKELKTKYKVIQDNEQSGCRTTFQIWNDGLIRTYGLMQGYTKAEQNENPRTLGTNLFAEYSRVPYDITVNNVIGSLNLYPGAKIWFDLHSNTKSLYREGFRGYARVNSVTHRLGEGLQLMDLDLSFVESA